MKIFIIGINGFIGRSLSGHILKNRPTWHVIGLDPDDSRISELLSSPRLTFRQGSMASEASWIEEAIQESDIVLPLAAIANPALYVTKPLQVFELDFEANLAIVRLVVQYGKHLLFPSTSEVYGISPDTVFDEETSPLMVGPISKQRWIYSASKQLLDRIIYAYGQSKGLSYTLFRPFNWIGPYLDKVCLKKGGEGRVVVKMLGQILRHLDIEITGSGEQRRSFTDIEDAIRALVLMMESAHGKAQGKIYNVGNPANAFTINELGTCLLNCVAAHPHFKNIPLKSRLVHRDPQEMFGASYQDIQNRVPAIARIQQDLGWTPHVDLKTSLERIVDFHIERLFYGKLSTSSSISKQHIGGG
jgi:nucleoside-diphosphate-sugar epimerase